MPKEHIAYAMRYAEHGFPVLPLHFIRDDGYCSCGDRACKRPGKHPFSRFVPNGLKQATRNETCLRDWFSCVKRLNIGLLCGSASGCVVLDADTRSGGVQRLHGIEAEYPTVARTLRQITGSGGLHVLMHYDGSDIRPSAGTLLGAGIDVRAEDSYIVAAPSNHVSGGVYRWEGHREILPIPEPLANLLKSRSAFHASPVCQSVGGACGVIPKGRQHVTLMSYAGVLARYGFTLDAAIAALSVMAQQCEEVPPPDHIARIARSAMKYQQAPNSRSRPLSVPEIVASVVKNLPDRR